MHCWGRRLFLAQSWHGHLEVTARNAKGQGVAEARSVKMSTKALRKSQARISRRPRVIASKQAVPKTAFLTLQRNAQPRPVAMAPVARLTARMKWPRPTQTAYFLVDRALHHLDKLNVVVLDNLLRTMMRFRTYDRSAMCRWPPKTTEAECLTSSTRSSCNLIVV